MLISLLLETNFAHKTTFCYFDYFQVSTVWVLQFCRFIAKTMHGDDEEDDTPQNEKTVEPPKLLGVHPSSNEKVLVVWL